MPGPNAAWRHPAPGRLRRRPPGTGFRSRRADTDGRAGSDGGSLHEVSLLPGFAFEINPDSSPRRDSFTEAPSTPWPTNHGSPTGCPRRGTVLARLLPPREGGQAAGPPRRLCPAASRTYVGGLPTECGDVARRFQPVPERGRIPDRPWSAKALFMDGPGPNLARLRARCPGHGGRSPRSGPGGRTSRCAASEGRPWSVPGGCLARSRNIGMACTRSGSAGASPSRSALLSGAWIRSSGRLPSSLGISSFVIPQSPRPWDGITGDRMVRTHSAR